MGNAARVVVVAALLARMTDEVKIAHHKPCPCHTERDSKHVLDKSIGQRVIGGGVNVSQGDDNARGSTCQRYGNRKAGLGGGKPGVRGGVPGGDPPPRLPPASLATNCESRPGKKVVALSGSNGASLDSWRQTKVGSDEYREFLTISHLSLPPRP